MIGEEVYSVEPEEIPSTAQGSHTKVDVSLEKLKHCKALCARAADRIYMWVDAGLDPSIETKLLIAELRKAAK